MVGEVTEDVALPCRPPELKLPHHVFLCLTTLNTLTLRCLSHCSASTNLCAGKAQWLYSSPLLVGSPPHAFIVFPPTNKADTASMCRYSSLLIKSDNTLVTVMLTINHTGSHETGGQVERRMMNVAS